MDSQESGVALLIGSGAIENAWKPIRGALAEVYDDRHIPEGEENFAFANIVFRLRFLALNAVPSSRHHAEMKAQLEKGLAFYGKLKAAICQKLKDARESGELRLRPEFDLIRDNLLGSHNCIITTNWDRTLEGKIRGCPVYYLHGVIENPGEMYLPTEITQEPFRAEEQIAAIMRNHVVCCDLLERARKLVIYGLSISPLDAELGLAIADSMVNRTVPLEEVIVVDPRPELVAVRVRFLWPKLTVKTYSLDELCTAFGSAQRA